MLICILAAHRQCNRCFFAGLTYKVLVQDSQEYLQVNRVHKSIFMLSRWIAHPVPVINSLQWYAPLTHTLCTRGMFHTCDGTNTLPIIYQMCRSDLYIRLHCSANVNYLPVLGCVVGRPFPHWGLAILQGMLPHTSAFAVHWCCDRAAESRRYLEVTVKDRPRNKTMRTDVCEQNLVVYITRGVGRAFVTRHLSWTNTIRKVVEIQN